MLNHYSMSDPSFHAINGLFYIFCHYDLENVGSRSDLFWLLLLFEAIGIKLHQCLISDSSSSTHSLPVSSEHWVIISAEPVNSFLQRVNTFPQKVNSFPHNEATFTHFSIFIIVIHHRFFRGRSV